MNYADSLMGLGDDDDHVSSAAAIYGGGGWDAMTAAAAARSRLAAAAAAAATYGTGALTPSAAAAAVAAAPFLMTNVQQQAAQAAAAAAAVAQMDQQRRLSSWVQAAAVAQMAAAQEQVSAAAAAAAAATAAVAQKQSAVGPPTVIRSCGAGSSSGFGSGSGFSAGAGDGSCDDSEAAGDDCATSVVYHKAHAIQEALWNHHQQQAKELIHQEEIYRSNKKEEIQQALKRKELQRKRQEKKQQKKQESQQAPRPQQSLQLPKEAPSPHESPPQPDELPQSPKHPHHLRQSQPRNMLQKKPQNPRSLQEPYHELQQPHQPQQSHQTWKPHQLEKPELLEQHMARQQLPQLQQAHAQLYQPLWKHQQVKSKPQQENKRKRKQQDISAIENEVAVTLATKIISSPCRAGRMTSRSPAGASVLESVGGNIADEIGIDKALSLHTKNPKQPNAASRISEEQDGVMETHKPSPNEMSRQRPQQQKRQRKQKLHQKCLQPVTDNMVLSLLVAAGVDPADIILQEGTLPETVTLTLEQLRAMAQKAINDREQDTAAETKGVKNSFLKAKEETNKDTDQVELSRQGQVVEVPHNRADVDILSLEPENRRIVSIKKENEEDEKDGQQQDNKERQQETKNKKLLDYILDKHAQTISQLRKNVQSLDEERQSIQTTKEIQPQQADLKSTQKSHRKSIQDCMKASVQALERLKKNSNNFKAKKLNNNRLVEDYINNYYHNKGNGTVGKNGIPKNSTSTRNSCKYNATTITNNTNNSFCSTTPPTITIMPKSKLDNDQEISTVSIPKKLSSNNNSSSNNNMSSNSSDCGSHCGIGF